MSAEPSIVLINSAEPNPLGPDSAKIRALILSAAWGVANAPRPLPGEFTWAGEYRHGIFYAAGPLATFAERWDDLDGWQVIETSNAEIEARVRAMCEERGTPFEEILSDFDGDLGAVARACDLPWSNVAGIGI